MNVALEAVYHSEDDNEPYIKIGHAFEEQAVYLVPAVVDSDEMEANDTHIDDKEESGQAAVGSFTVEARIEGVSEAWADALAVWLAQKGLTVKVWWVQKQRAGE